MERNKSPSTHFFNDGLSNIGCGRFRDRFLSLKHFLGLLGRRGGLGDNDVRSFGWSLLGGNCRH